MKQQVMDVLLRLIGAGDGQSAPELLARLGKRLSQPTLWRYLNALRSRGLVTREGRGRATRYYSAARTSPAERRRAYEGVRAAPVPNDKPMGSLFREPAHPVQIEGFRRMTPEDKLRLVAGLYGAGIQLKVAGLRMVHPDWTEARLLHEARSSLLHAGT
ncbi:MAG: hypothetical protein HYR49_05035 [Gammaproteobacteria bacterium]|nr:hypothetical protein [Gammaproteobacteria bacterium]